MACPVNAVEITASAMIAGTNTAPVLAERAEREQAEPDQQGDRDEHGQQQLLAVAQQQLQLESVLRGQHPRHAARGRGSGVKVPAGNS